MDNLIELTPHSCFYQVANSLNLKPDSHHELIQFITRMLKYKNTKWIVMILGMHIENKTLQIQKENPGTP